VPGRFNHQQGSDPVSDKKDDYDLGREIEKAWLYRGEIDKVIAVRGKGMILVGVLVLLSLFSWVIFSVLDIPAEGKPLIISSVIIGLIVNYVAYLLVTS
jgi:hypothetical protein